MLETIYNKCMHPWTRLPFTLMVGFLVVGMLFELSIVWWLSVPIAIITFFGVAVVFLATMDTWDNNHRGSKDHFYPYSSVFGDKGEDGV